MRAVILAAGLSSRLSGGVPKTLLPLEGRTSIMGYTIDQLEKLGMDITVVIGYKAPFFLSTLSSQVTFVYNPIYASTATLYSLKVAVDLLGFGPMLICYADQITKIETITKLIQTPDCVLVTPFTKEASADYTLRIKDGTITEIAYVKKHSPRAGLFAFGGFAFLSERTLKRIDKLFFHVLATKDVPVIFSGCRAMDGWCENINTPADLIRVQRRLRGT